MELSIYKQEQFVAGSIANFMDFYYRLQMNHLASDLLQKGLSPDQITDAVSKAVKVAKAYGLDASKHFRPVFSGIDAEIIRDCKLSHLAYGLVMMNANEELIAVAEFQVSVLQKFLSSSDG